MTTQVDKDIRLPFGDLPEPPTPSVPASQSPKRRVSKIKQLVAGCNWEAYEEGVLGLLREAIEQYQRQGWDERVYQISIWTDPQAQLSAISFETKEHAEEHVAKWTRIFRGEYGDEKTAARLEAEGYNGSPADFKYTRFLERNHPEIAALNELDYRYVTHSSAAEARISTSLRKVVKRIREQDLLASLPTEEEFWVGVNSPRDWYDHVTKIKGQP